MLSDDWVQLTAYYYAWVAIMLLFVYWKKIRWWSHFWIWWNGGEVMARQVFLHPPWPLDIMVLLHPWVLWWMGMSWHGVATLLLLHLLPWFAQIVGLFGWKAFYHMGNLMQSLARLSIIWLGIAFFGGLHAFSVEVFFRIMLWMVWVCYSAMALGVMINAFHRRSFSWRLASFLYFCTVQIFFFGTPVLAI